MSRTFRTTIPCFPNPSMAWYCGLAVLVTHGVTGCTHLIETRAITSFSKNLESANLDGLKESTTDEFAQRALRTAAALEDLKILRLPDGKTSVVEVEEITDSKKRVTVHVGESKKEVFYELARNPNGKWVVDEIYLKQKKKGVEAHKSVSEQMDLLLTVREFVDSWSRGDREQVLAVTNPEFGAALETLPPSYLAHLTQMVSTGRPTNGQYKPQAQLDEKLAVVKLPRMTGECVVTLELNDDEHWQVADVGISSKEEDDMPSMYKEARAVNCCTQFLAAYERSDKTALADLCSKDFFDGSLSIGDLSQVKLPDSQLSDHQLQVKVRGNRADFVLQNDNEYVQIDMHRMTDTTPGAPTKFSVTDVTIYEVNSKQEKRLSALFTAQGMLDVFVKSLALRDLSALKHCSTRDMTTRVWSKLDADTVNSMPLQLFDESQFEIVSSSFQGALTKIEVRQANRPLTYLLREEHGRFLVDDVNWHVTGIPSSLKTTVEILIPIQNFAQGVAMGRSSQDHQSALDRLRSCTSSDFNRLVWSQCNFVPTSGMAADTFLRAPLKSIAQSDNEIQVQFGDNRYGAKVTIRKELDHFAIDDIVLIAGPEESQRLAIKHTLRTQLARGELRSPNPTITAAAPANNAPTQKGVVQAKATVVEGSRNPNPVRTANAIEVADDPFASDLP